MASPGAQSSEQNTPVKEEVSIQEIVDVEQASSEQFDTETAFDTLNNCMQESYCSVFTAPFHEILRDYEGHTEENN